MKHIASLFVLAALPAIAQDWARDESWARLKMMASH
jgi:hypothetical protein